MSKITTPDLVEPAAVATLVQVTNLLWKAGREAWARFDRDHRDVASVELAIETGRLWEMAALMTPEDADVHQGSEEGKATGEDPVVLLRRAEQLTREHPIHAFPAGTGAMVVELIDLVREQSRE